MKKEPTIGGIGRAYQAGKDNPDLKGRPPLIAGLPGSAARKMFRNGQRDARKARSPLTTGSEQ